MIALSESEEFRITMTHLKLMELRLNDKMDRALKNQDHMQASTDTLTRITSHLDSDFESILSGRRASVVAGKHDAVVMSEALGGGKAVRIASSESMAARSSGEGGGGERSGDELERAFTAVLRSIEAKLDKIGHTVVGSAGVGQQPGNGEVNTTLQKKDFHPWQSRVRRMSIDPLFQVTMDDLRRTETMEHATIDNSTESIEHTKIDSSTESIEHVKIDSRVFLPLPHGGASKPLPPALLEEKEEECQKEKASDESEGVGDAETFVLGSVNMKSPLMARRKKRRDQTGRGKQDESDRGNRWTRKESQERDDKGPSLTQIPEAGEEKLKSLSRRLLHSPRSNDVEIEKHGEAEMGAGGGEGGIGRGGSHEGNGEMFEEKPTESRQLKQAADWKGEATARTRKTGIKSPEGVDSEKSVLLPQPATKQGSDLVLVGGLELQEARSQQAAPSSGIKYTPSNLPALFREGDVTAAELRRRLLSMPAGQQPWNTSPPRPSSMAASLPLRHSGVSMKSSPLTPTTSASPYPSPAQPPNRHSVASSTSKSNRSRWTSPGLTGIGTPASSPTRNISRW